MQAEHKKVRGIVLFSCDGRTTPDPGLSDAGLARANLPDDLATVSGAFGLEFVQGEPSCPLLFLCSPILDSFATTRLQFSSTAA